MQRAPRSAKWPRFESRQLQTGNSINSSWSRSRGLRRPLEWAKVGPGGRAPGQKCSQRQLAGDFSAAAASLLLVLSCRETAGQAAASCWRAASSTWPAHNGAGGGRGSTKTYYHHYCRSLFSFSRVAPSRFRWPPSDKFKRAPLCVRAPVPWVAGAEQAS